MEEEQYLQSSLTLHSEDKEELAWQRAPQAEEPVGNGGVPKEVAERD